MSKLTQKQENFVQALVSGKSQREAYKEAYNAANMKDSTVDKRACELLKNGKVAARYNELMSKQKEAIEKKLFVDDLEIDKSLLEKVDKYKSKNQTRMDYIIGAIINSFPKEDISEEEIELMNKRSRYINKSTRYAVMERAGFKCQCCGAKPTKDNDVTLHIDHIIPFSLGGSNDLNSLQVLCNKCNCSKNNKWIINHNDDKEEVR